MFKHLKSCLAPALLGIALCSPVAQATDFTLDPANLSQTEFISIGLFGSTDSVTFTLNMLGAAGTAGDAMSTLDLSMLLGTSLGGTVEIFDITGVGSYGSASLPLLAVASPYTSFANLLDGDYKAVFTKGAVSLSLNNTFSVDPASVTAVPMPEAETYAMLALGLPLVVLAARRRRRA
jgi:hypothetical protein